jgi:hypothetical protein
MVMSDSLLTAIACSSDRKWLEQCRDHNARLGKKNIVEATSTGRIPAVNHTDHRLSPAAGGQTRGADIFRAQRFCHILLPQAFGGAQSDRENLWDLQLMLQARLHS